MSLSNNVEDQESDPNSVSAQVSHSLLEHDESKHTQEESVDSRPTPRERPIDHDHDHDDDHRIHHVKKNSLTRDSQPNSFKSTRSRGTNSKSVKPIFYKERKPRKMEPRGSLNVTTITTEEPGPSTAGKIHKWTEIVAFLVVAIVFTNYVLALFEKPLSLKFDEEKYYFLSSIVFESVLIFVFIFFLIEYFFANISYELLLKASNKILKKKRARLSSPLSSDYRDSVRQEQRQRRKQQQQQHQQGQGQGQGQQQRKRRNSWRDSKS